MNSSPDHDRQDSGSPEHGQSPDAARAEGAMGKHGYAAPRQSRRLRVGEALIEQGAITREQLDRALAEQRTSRGAGGGTPRLIGEVLVEQGVLTTTTLVRSLASHLRVPGCQLRHGLIDPSLLKQIGEEEATRLRAIPMFKVRGTMTVAMAEPQNLPAIDRLRQLTGCKIRPVLALEANIREFIKKYSGENVDVNEFLTSLAEQDVEVVDRESVDDGPTTDLDKMVQGAPIVNLVNIAFLTAVKDRASDIHIEPDKKGTRVRYRVHGILRDVMKPPAGMHAAIVSRVKVVGKMDIAEKRLPQEGRVRIVAEGREIDLRISSMPTLLGEKIVVRILDKQNLKVRLSDLGFRPETLVTFTDVLKRPHGAVLVTGPTGSGKTTTLYSALDLLRTPEVNIVTVEDPVEYQLDLINQIQVNEPIGLSFARVLRSVLRQDPDIIMVGEIRDYDTARVAIQAALTGHLVLATLHTNDAPGAIARLTDMGIENYLLSSALNGVVAQRLARTICGACATMYYPSQQVLADAGLLERVGRPFRKGGGCRQCHDSGFQGRVGVYEVMEVTPPIRQMIHDNRPAHDIREKLRESGSLTLRDEGVLLAMEGKTSLEEVLRVTHTDDVEAGDSHERLKTKEAA
jgi:type IV pilus assembly protein PilB